MPNAWLHFPTAPAASARNENGDLAPANSYTRPPQVEVGSLPGSANTKTFDAHPTEKALAHITCRTRYNKHVNMQRVHPTLAPLNFTQTLNNPACHLMSHVPLRSPSLLPAEAAA